MNLFATERQHWKGWVLLLACSAVLVLWGKALESTATAHMVDFKCLFYSSRALLQHRAPYRADAVLPLCLQDNQCRTTDLPVRLEIVSVCMYLPSALAVLLPLATIPFTVAHILWFCAISFGLVAAAVLIWCTSRPYHGATSLLLVCLLMSSCAITLGEGNAAGLVVGLTVIAVWCFLNERLSLLGVAFLSLALLLKPHDAGFVWLYFLLAGGLLRKRAITVAIVVAATGMLALLLLWNVEPYWLADRQQNMRTMSAPGGMLDPGPGGLSTGNATRVIDLQSFLSMFRNDPFVYNAASYAICATLLAVWIFATLRGRTGPPNTWLALAAAVPLTMLITYHRPYDAKLLLLCVPACSMLVARRRMLGWLAFGITLASILSTSEISLAVLSIVQNKLHPAPFISVFDLPVATLLHPAPVALLAMAVFYVWIYARLSLRKTTDEATG